MGGTAASLQTRLDELKLFGRTLRNMPVAFETMDDSMPRDGAPIGRAGLDLLRHFRLTFRPAGNALWVQWRPKDAKHEQPTPGKQ